MPAAAIVGLVGAGASIYSANKQSKAAKDAARAQTGAAEDSNKLYWDMYQQSRTDNEPFRQNALTAQQEYMNLLGLGSPAPAQTQSAPQFGTAGLFNGMTTGGLAQGQQIGGTSRGGVGSLLGHADGDMRVQHSGFGPIMQQAIARGRVPSTGIPGGAMPTPQTAAPQTGVQGQQAAFDRFRNTPGYQFGLQEGRGQLESSAAARGGLYSGATFKALQRYGNDYADQQGFTPYMNRLASLAGMGQTANAQNAQMGMNTVQGMGQNLMAAGNARASGLIGQGNASAGLAQNLTGIAGMLGGLYQNRGGWG